MAYEQLQICDEFAIEYYSSLVRQKSFQVDYVGFHT